MSLPLLDPTNDRVRQGHRRHVDFNRRRFRCSTGGAATGFRIYPGVDRDENKIISSEKNLPELMLMLDFASATVHGLRRPDCCRREFHRRPSGRPSLDPARYGNHRPAARK